VKPLTDAALRRHPVLVQVARNLGAHAAEHRLAAARAREQEVRAYLAAVEAGASATEARRQLGVSLHFASVVERYRREGVLGLVDRRSGGKRKEREAVDEAELRGPERRSWAHSFLRWVGSKKSALPALLPRIPPTYGRYYEPMVGSGALFLALRPERAVLGDKNADLMNAWRAVQRRPDELLAALRRRRNTIEDYHAQRALDPSTLPPIERAARLVYLTQTSFNGLHRVNRHGVFNVPFGHRRSVKLANDVAVRRVHEALRGVQLRVGDVRQTCRDAEAGDLVYLDPPYHDELANKRVRYHVEAFTDDHQRDLADFARELDARGCLVLVSHSDSPFIRGLFPGFHLEVHGVHRRVGGTGAPRGKKPELLLRNYPKLPPERHRARASSSETFPTPSTQLLLAL